VQAAGVRPSASSSGGVNAHGDISFVLRGDAALACDEPVEPGQVLGRVVSVQRHGRRLDPSSGRARIWCDVRRRAVRLKRALLYRISHNTVTIRSKRKTGVLKKGKS
jgi:hypothetical protein